MLVDAKRCEELMVKFRLDTVIAMSPENAYYLSGYSSLEPDNTLFAVIISKGHDLVLLTAISDIGSVLFSECWVKDRRYYGKYYVEGMDLNVYSEDAIMGIQSILREMGVDSGRIGVEENYVPFKIYKRISDSLPKAQLLDAREFLDELRIIKTQEEIKRVREVVKISERALMRAYETAGEGATELEVKKALQTSLVRDGATWAFIEMGAGERGSIVNTQPSNYVMKEGDVLRLDFGTIYRGYCSDISRSAVVGEPSRRQRKVYEALLQGYYRMVEEAKPGVEFSKLFSIGMNAVRKVFPKYWRLHLGHGIGLTTHEKPYIRADEKGFLKTGMVFTFELPYYIRGLGGFNIEDVMVVGEDGCESISTIDRSLHML